MEKLTNKEELIMTVMWKLKKAFVKDVMKELQDQKLHYNTVSTMIRNLEEKKFISHDSYGKTHQYFPIITKEEYGRNLMTVTAEKFFGNSYKSLFSYFARQEKISADELREILDLIEKKG
jgi:BlaI family transcriptional regulator, penicillinase repressor